MESFVLSKLYDEYRELLNRETKLRREMQELPKGCLAKAEMDTLLREQAQLESTAKMLDAHL